MVMNTSSSTGGKPRWFEVWMGCIGVPVGFSEFHRMAYFPDRGWLDETMTGIGPGRGGRRSFGRWLRAAVVPAAGVFHHRLGLAVDVEFFIDPLDVGADGAEADAEFTRDLFVRLTAG